MVTEDGSSSGRPRWRERIVELRGDTGSATQGRQVLRQLLDFLMRQCGRTVGRHPRLRMEPTGRLHEAVQPARGVSQSDRREIRALFPPLAGDAVAAGALLRLVQGAPGPLNGAERPPDLLLAAMGR